jgi:hypothetical protein
MTTVFFRRDRRTILHEEGFGDFRADDYFCGNVRLMEVEKRREVCKDGRQDR